MTDRPKCSNDFGDRRTGITYCQNTGVWQRITRGRYGWRTWILCDGCLKIIQKMYHEWPERFDWQRIKA